MVTRIYALIGGAGLTVGLLLLCLGMVHRPVSAQAHSIDHGPVELVRMATPLTTTQPHTLYLPALLFFVPTPENGGFEAGPVLWDPFSTNGQTLIRSAGELAVAPYAGGWAARLGGLDDEISMLSQGLAISADQACLRYWQWTVSDDACNADYGGVGINGHWAAVHSLCAGTATARWVRIQVDLSNHVTLTGTTLNFAVSNDYSAPSTMYVDEIAFQPTRMCDCSQDELRSSAYRPESLTSLIGQPISGDPQAAGINE